MITDYSKYLENLYKGKEMFERTFNKEKMDTIKRLKDSGDYVSLIEEIKKTIVHLQDEIKILNFDEIKYKKLSYGRNLINNKRDIFIMEYNGIIDTLITLIKREIDNIDDDSISNKIFQDGYRDMNLEVELSGDFNQIDIMNGLPNFMKGIGLGKKVYKKMMKDYNYISSFNGNNPSKDSDMVWKSIASDKDVYIFMNDDNIICFWNEYEYDKIVEKLKEFYDIKGIMNFDDDFMIKYDLDDNKLKDILNK